MNTIVLANAAEYPCEWCAAMNGTLGMNIVTDASLAALAAAFGDPANTARIELRGGAETQTFEGYTDLRVLNAGGWKEGSTLIILRKGE